MDVSLMPQGAVYTNPDSKIFQLYFLLQAKLRDIRQSLDRQQTETEHLAPLDELLIPSGEEVDRILQDISKVGRLRFMGMYTLGPSFVARFMAPDKVSSRLNYFVDLEQHFGEPTRVEPSEYAMAYVLVLGNQQVNLTYFNGQTSEITQPIIRTVKLQVE